MSKTEAQLIIYYLGNCEFEKVKQQIYGLKTHLNNLIYDNSCLKCYNGTLQNC